jgi:hypothetical protein
VADRPLDGKRVAYLVKLLRRRTPEEITTGVMALAGSFTPEMWCALEFLRLQRRQNPRRSRPRAADRSSEPVVAGPGIR